MALYYYQAFTKDGKKITGSIDSSSIQTVREILNRQGIFPISISLDHDNARQPWWKRLFRRGVSLKDKILFTKQLATLLKSGVQLLQALELLVEHFTGTFGGILSQVKDDIKEGSSLAKSLKKFPNVFDNIYVQLVRAGEASGKLETILERLVEYMEQREAMSKRIWSALRQPLMQLVVSFLVVGFLLVVAVPQMAEVFSSFDKELPWTTRFLMGISNFILNHYLAIIISFVTLVAGFFYWKSTPSGARTFDQIILRLPLIGYFARMNAVVQFSRTLGMLFESGVNLPESLDIVVNIVDNKVLADALAQARDKIIKQGKISQYLKQTEMFPPIAIYLVKTGEESGRLDAMLLTIAQNYEKELSEEAEKLAAKAGPLLLIVMAIIVGFIIMAMMLPIVQMGELVNA